MFAAVTGGLLFQVPVGRLSDRFDRRRVLAALGVSFAAAAVALVLLPHRLAVVLTPTVLLGGFLSTLYPVCAAYAFDCLPRDRVVAVSGHLILTSGVGSVLGPLIGTSVMAGFGINGLLYFMAGTALALALAAARSNLRSASPEHQERPFDLLTPQATPLAHEQRADPDEPAAPQAGPLAPPPGDRPGSA